jgi:hypothetical protein
MKKKLIGVLFSLLSICAAAQGSVIQGEESAGVYANLKSTTGILQIYNQTWASSTNTVWLPNAVRTASQVLTDQSNTLYHGIYVFCNITVAPGVETINFQVWGKDTLSGVYYQLAGSLDRTTTGMVIIKISPYLGVVAAATGGQTANEYLPATWRLMANHSASGNWTYSCSYAMTAN